MITTHGKGLPASSRLICVFSHRVDIVREDDAFVRCGPIQDERVSLMKHLCLLDQETIEPRNSVLQSLRMRRLKFSSASNWTIG